MMASWSEESSLPSSDPFRISPCKSPLRHSSLPSKAQQDIVPSSPRPYPVSIRTYNKKDYDYIASFSRATLKGMKLNESESELSHCQEIWADDGVAASSMHPAKQSHALLPKFGAWNDEAPSSSVEGYTNVFECAREQKRGCASPAQSQPQHPESPIRHLATKELTVAKTPSQISSPRKWSSSSWSRCFVAPVTTE